jgi:hypothetical protein
MRYQQPVADKIEQDESFLTLLRQTLLFSATHYTIEKKGVNIMLWMK